MRKGRNEVYSPDDMDRVQEAESSGVRLSWHKADAMKTVVLPPASVRHVPTEPSHPQDVHPATRLRVGCAGRVVDVDVKDGDYASVPKRMRIVVILVSTDHDISLSARVETILLATKVVRSVVYSACAVQIDAVLDDDEGCALLVGEAVLVAVVLVTKHPREQMISQSWSKVLRSMSLRSNQKDPNSHAAQDLGIVRLWQKYWPQSTCQCLVDGRLDPRCDGDR
jgi:hypothetical protein